VGYRAVLAWCAVAGLAAACGRLGFEEQSAEHQDGAGDGDGPLGGDGPTSDGPISSGIDSDPSSPDAPPGGPDAMIAACPGWMSCPIGEVTCCDASGTPACIAFADTCPTPHRYECDFTTSEGCFSPEICCLTMDSQGTECANPAMEMCFG
jgi:hypothetical protein